jgi:hypothetical protein
MTSDILYDVCIIFSAILFVTSAEISLRIKRLGRSQHDSLINCSATNDSPISYPELAFLQLYAWILSRFWKLPRPHESFSCATTTRRQPPPQEHNFIKVLSQMRPCSQNSSQRDTATISLPEANVTPCDNARTSIELMSLNSDLMKMRREIHQHEGIYLACRKGRYFIRSVSRW